ncbi:hypothetical protein [Microbacterium wangchenii]|uniref:Uncharacterized protein n=1 Tax=Microbacterium wangchenii TaxID=2541726 RepID=A0ABX5SUR9_9MICO|nr:hypothetical protein [Microbacterium wangchenii]QBR89552.1 hypothetical protein E4K62_13220 [Microbacterium wangchenii]TXK16850.1 hypothetical protein FVP99_09295 [Microbacterium wangchenii]
MATLLDVDDARGRRGPTFAEAWSLRIDGLTHRLHLFGWRVPRVGHKSRDGRTPPRLWIRFAIVLGSGAFGTVAVGGWVVFQSHDIEPAPGLTLAESAEITTWFGANQAVERATEDIGACLREAGVDAHVRRESHNTGVSIEMGGMGTNEQQALSACASSIADIAPPIQDAGFRADAYQWIHGQYDCLLGAGFALPAAPTLEEFENEIEQLGAVGWNPISDAADIIGSEHAGQARALDACPADTPIW